MNVNMYEKMWANVQHAERQLASTPMNGVIDYLREHNWATVEEMGKSIYGTQYDDVCYKRLYASKIGAVMHKLLHNGYVEVKSVKKEGAAPIYIVKEDFENIYLTDTADMFELKSEGWSIQLYSHKYGNKIGYASRKVVINKVIEPTVKVYHLIVKD